jgi:Ca2+-binding RTX toxin-like protein
MPQPLDSEIQGTDNAEQLISGAGNDSIYGGGGDDALYGGESGDDFLAGGLGDDTLYGGDGNDTLSGGASDIDPMQQPDSLPGDDTMYGGDGNDLYIVNSKYDLVFEGLNEGITDRVQSSVAYTLTDNVEDLALMDSQDIDGTGNTLNNLLQGNDGKNVLTALNGNDTLYGGGGNDVNLRRGPSGLNGFSRRPLCVGCGRGHTLRRAGIG